MKKVNLGSGDKTETGWVTLDIRTKPNWIDGMHSRPRLEVLMGRNPTASQQPAATDEGSSLVGLIHDRHSGGRRGSGLSPSA